jgi:hypothetical protein
VSGCSWRSSATPGQQRRNQVDVVRDTARGMGDVIEPLEESDISGDIAVAVAAQFYAHPGQQICVMQVAQP